jgi:glyoxylase-like metal-dependent hydrolase (beta-lactamase superfamily II)
VLVQDGDTSVFLAGDTSYNEALMLAGALDGVSADEAVARSTLQAVGALVQNRPTVYLPTHDPDSGARLANRRPAGR